MYIYVASYTAKLAVIYTEKRNKTTKQKSRAKQTKKGESGK